MTDRPRSAQRPSSPLGRAGSAARAGGGAIAGLPHGLVGLFWLLPTIGLLRLARCAAPSDTPERLVDSVFDRAQRSSPSTTTGTCSTTRHHRLASGTRC